MTYLGQVQRYPGMKIVILADVKALLGGAPFRACGGHWQRVGVMEGCERGDQPQGSRVGKTRFDLQAGWTSRLLTRRRHCGN